MGQDIQLGQVEFTDEVHTGLGVCQVRIPCRRTGIFLQEYLDAERRQLLHRFRCGRHTPFTLPAFPRYAQFHPPTPLAAVARGRASRVAPDRLTGGNVAERLCCT